MACTTLSAQDVDQVNLLDCYSANDSMLLLPAGYSLWTNRSFKTPLLVAALVCIFGNVLYAVGYDVKTLWILLVSRLLVGFGKPT